MPRMIELLRASLVPHNIVQTASKGALAVPAPEMIEILVYLATENKVFGEQSAMTLAAWDATSLKASARDPEAPKEVLEYLISPQNIRLPLLSSLLENLSVSEAAIAELAASASRDAIEIMLQSARVNLSEPVLAALSANPNLSGQQSEAIRSKQGPPKPEGDEVLPAPAAPPAEGDNVLDEELVAYLNEHAEEIVAEGEKAFHPIGGLHDDVLAHPDELPHEHEEEEGELVGAGGAAAKRAPAKKASLNVGEQRGSALQKISKLDVKGRIQLAMKGTKEERSILVRDGTKVVALAVLESPKITDAEVERYAGQKNVLEALLRGIPLKRRFVKHYGIVRNLVFNPRTPLDVSLGLIKNLLVNDLKNLSGNKEVSDTVKKLALKMFKQKKDSGKK